MLYRSILAALILVWASGAQAQSKPLHDPSRGELLYTTHCIACHTDQVHWRDKALVTDWTSLQLQVWRWQANAKLAWNNGDVADVARYLNTLFYHFPGPA
jgi:hypothetical protein